MLARPPVEWPQRDQLPWFQTNARTWCRVTDLPRQPFREGRRVRACQARRSVEYADLTDSPGDPAYQHPTNTSRSLNTLNLHVLYLIDEAGHAWLTALRLYVVRLVIVRGCPEPIL